MPQFHRKTCRHCGRTAEEAGPISGAGWCPGCGDERYIANHRELQDHSGPFFDHWRRRCLAAFGVTLEEDATA